MRCASSQSCEEVNVSRPTKVGGRNRGLGPAAGNDAAVRARFSENIGSNLRAGPGGTTKTSVQE